MTIKDFINKAIEGGWKDHISNMEWKWAWENAVTPFLDPKAWEAVGKVEGWNGQNGGYGRETLCSWKSTWQQNMHQMIDALVEGKTLEEFIETL